MRVLFLNPLGGLGGAERALIDLVAGLRAARPGWDLQLIASGDGILPARLRELGVPVAVMPFPALLARTGDAAGVGRNVAEQARSAARLSITAAASLAYVSRLRAAIRKAAPDIIHTNGFKMHVGAALANPVGVPIIWHVRDYVGCRPVMARLLPMLARRCRAAISNSRSVADDLRGVCPGLQVTPIHDAIDLERFSPHGPRLDLDALAKLPAAPEGTIKVGMLGTMARWKGQRIFLEALARLEPRLNVRGYIVGGQLYETDGSQYSLDELRLLARQLGMSERVGVTGFVEEPADAMRTLDIVVHASTSPEPFGLVIAEAMASGKPVITTACGGAAELVENEVDSLTAEAADPGKLAERISRLAADPSLRNRLGANGRAVARERFTRGRLIEQVLGVYGDVCREAA